MSAKTKEGTRVVEANDYGGYDLYIFKGQSDSGKTVQVKWPDGPIRRWIYPARLRVLDDEAKLKKLRDNNAERERLRLENVGIFLSMPELNLEGGTNEL